MTPAGPALATIAPMRHPDAVSARLVLLLALVALTSPPGPAAAAGTKDLVKWRPTVAAGESESKKGGKPVFYFVTAEWCGPCHQMTDEVFSDEKIAARINALYVPVQVVDRSVEEGQNTPEVTSILRRFRVNGFPTVVIMRPGQQDGVRVAGFPGKEEMAEAVDRAAVRLAEIDAREKAQAKEQAKAKAPGK